MIEKQGLGILSYLKTKYSVRLLTISQVSLEMGMCAQSVRNAISQGRFPIPTVKIGRSRKVEIERLAEYMDKVSGDAVKDFNYWKRLRGE